MASKKEGLYITIVAVLLIVTFGGCMGLIAQDGEQRRIARRLDNCIWVGDQPNKLVSITHRPVELVALDESNKLWIWSEFHNHWHRN